MKAGQFLLLRRLEDYLFVGGPLIVGQFIGQNRQIHPRIALQFARNMKAVFVQLPAAGREAVTRQIFIGPRSQNKLMLTYGLNC